jgi:hypothetical protein
MWFPEVFSMTGSSGSSGSVLEVQFVNSTKMGTKKSRRVIFMTKVTNSDQNSHACTVSICLSMWTIFGYDYLGHALRPVCSGLLHGSLA